MIYEGRFLSNLRQRIAEDLTARHTELGNGTQIVADDAAATGMRCARIMGAISSLKNVLTMIDQIEDEMSGKSKKKGME